MIRARFVELVTACALATSTACVPAGRLDDDPEGTGGGAGAPGSGGASGADPGATGGLGAANGGAPPGGGPHGGAAGSAAAGSGGTAPGGAAPGGAGGVATGGIATGGIATGGIATGGIATGGIATGGAPLGGEPSTGGAAGGVLAAGGASGAGGGEACSGPLAAPASVQASDGTYETKVAITWQAVPCAESYEVYRATAVDGPYELLGATSLTARDDLDVPDTVTHYYRVRAYSAAQGYGAYGLDTGVRHQGYTLVASWGSQGSATGQFNSAAGIDVDASNAVYVLDTYNNRVQKFTASGTFVATWGGITLGGDAGQFYYADAIHIEGSNLYVGDMQRVQRFSLAGTYLDEFAVAHDDVLDLDVANGSFYVAGKSSSNLTVQELDATYVAQGSWGSSGAGAGQFDWAVHLAVDPARSVVFVADEGHSQLHLFTLAGTFVFSWGSAGPGSAQLSSPGGIALDAEGFLYVADEGNGRVQKLRFTGSTFELVATWASPGARDLAINGEGQVVVLGDDVVRIYRRR